MWLKYFSFSLRSIFSLSPHPPSLCIHFPQDFDLFLPAFLQCLAAAGPHRVVLRLAGGKHSPGGIAGRCAQRGHSAAGRGDGRSLPALHFLTAGKSKTSSWKVPKTAFAWTLLPLILVCPHYLMHLQRLESGKSWRHPKGSKVQRKWKIGNAVHLFALISTFHKSSVRYSHSY